MIRKLILPLICIVLTSFLLSCTISHVDSDLKPEWIKGKSRKYPPEFYLTGVGYSDDRKTAEDMALAAIARIFQSEIQSKTSELEKYIQTELNGKTLGSRDILIEQMTSVAANKVLENVKIAEVWDDEPARRIYVLAVIDRKHAVVSIKERIDEIDSDVVMMQRKVATASDRIEKTRTTRAILKSLLEREVYNSDLRIISPSGAGIDPPAALSDVKLQLQNILSKEIKIGVQMEGPYNRDVRSSVIEGLAKEGFSIEEKGDSENLDILVRGRVSFENADMPQWKYVRWNITVDIINQSNGRVFGSLTRQGREGHINFRDAEDRALRSLKKDILSELNQHLVSFIYGEDYK